MAATFVHKWENRLEAEPMKVIELKKELEKVAYNGKQKMKKKFEIKYYTVKR